MHKKDEQLVQRVMKGDLEAFNHLTREYQGAIYGLAYHWTHNFADAEDIMQEALIQAFENLSKLRDPERFPGWLRTIALNICRKRQRGKHHPLLSLDSPSHHKIRAQLKDPNQRPDQKLETQERQRAIKQTLKVLSKDVRLTVTLFYIDDLSHKQISEFLEVPVSTVKSRLHRARQTLKEEAVQMVEETLESQQKPSVVVREVSGYLHIGEDGDGHLRQTLKSPASPNDLFISKRFIWNYQMKQGDFIEAHFYSPDKDATQGYYRFNQINKTPVILQCAFCGRNKDAVDALVTGPGVNICETCVEACVDVLIKENGFRLGFTRTEAAHRTPETHRTPEVK